MTTELALSPPSVDDLSGLDPALRTTLEQLVSDGISKNTERSYTRFYKRFDEWCAERGLQSDPVTGAALGGYLAHLSTQSVQPSTLRWVTSVLAAREKAAGRVMSGTLETVAERAIKGHVEQRRYDASQKAFPLVPHRIREVVQGLDYNTFIGLRAGLILSVGYSGALRRSELAALRIGDLTPNENGLTLRIWKSKTDQQGYGRTRPIPSGDFVLTDPVTRLREYLEALASFGFDISDPSLPLLRAVNKFGNPRRPLPGKDGLSGYAVNLIISDACRIGGHPQWESVSGHSLRAGFATACAFSTNPPIPMAVWAEHGGWALTSQTPNLYVRDAGLVLNNPLNYVSV